MSTIYHMPEDSFVVGESPQMQHLYETIQGISANDSTVFITGETGTGKELVARLVHSLSQRKNSPFVYINCPALSSNLLESEIFGHEKGAFTGAELTRIGRFEAADKGTVLLDEISETDINFQAKLLQIVERKTFERVGSNIPRKLDVRIIATSNRDIPEMVKKGAFRADLFYRLNVVPIYLPPLRERSKQDVLQLIHYFLTYKFRPQSTMKTIHSRTFELLLNYDWPGNVRELFHIIERMMNTIKDNNIMPEHIAGWVNHNGQKKPGSAQDLAGISLQDMEKEIIRVNLLRNEGNRQRTASTLGITDRTLRNKIREYGIDS
ncbi:MAG: sigma-54-dependent Fis family transcriptional regulator [Planctomycetes bacterium]|nr:sigma-54-dependent Fis family transcriptional regulator [Planctomycetota bacterium]